MPPSSNDFIATLVQQMLDRQADTIKSLARVEANQITTQTEIANLRASGIVVADKIAILDFDRLGAKDRMSQLEERGVALSPEDARKARLEIAGISRLKEELDDMTERAADAVKSEGKRKDEWKIAKRGVFITVGLLLLSNAITLIVTHVLPLIK